MNIVETNRLLAQLQSQVGSIYCQSIPIDVKMVFAVREGIAKAAQQISEINHAVSNRLITLKDTLFTESTYQQYNTVTCQQFFINPIVCGQIIEALEFAKSVMNQANCGSLCHLLHPAIQRVSEKLYKDGNYAEAACNAFIEVDFRLQKVYREKRPNMEKELSGQTLMNKIFADNDPVLEVGDLTTQTGKDIQSGTRFLFAGAMAALRNPKSHQNIILEKNDAMRRLVFASMLMYKLDEIIRPVEGE